MAYAVVKCQFCGKPIVMHGAPDIPEGVTIDALWKLKLDCPWCQKTGEYPASALKSIFPGTPEIPPE